MADRRDHKIMPPNCTLGSGGGNGELQKGAQDLVILASVAAGCKFRQQRVCCPASILAAAITERFSVKADDLFEETLAAQTIQKAAQPSRANHCESRFPWEVAQALLPKGRLAATTSRAKSFVCATSASHCATKRPLRLYSFIMPSYQGRLETSQLTTNLETRPPDSRLWPTGGS